MHGNSALALAALHQHQSCFILLLQQTDRLYGQAVVIPDREKDKIRSDMYFAEISHYSITVIEVILSYLKTSLPKAVFAIYVVKYIVIMIFQTRPYAG